MRFWTVTPEEVRRVIDRVPRRMAMRKTPGVKTKPPKPTPPPIIDSMADFTLPSGYTITINEDGLSRLMLNGAVLGEGSAELMDGNWFYRKPLDPAGQFPTLSSKSVTYNSSGPTIVTHRYTGLLNATVVYTYTVSGNDVHVSAYVINTHATKPLQPGFRSMRFLNSAVGTYLNLGDQSQTMNKGEQLSYPSSQVPYSASTLSAPSTSGPQINLGTWSEEHPSEKFMTMLFGIYPNPGVAIGGVFFNRVPPGGSRIYKYALRFHNSSNWKDLLGGYKTHLRAAFPTVAYEPDARPLVSFSSIHSSYIRPDNPYGYNDGGNGVFRRFDTLAGCQDYVAKLTGPMASTGYQGIVLWQPQGIHPRNFQYRPDFNVFPSVTIPNLPTLVNGFRNAGLSIGLLARPNIAITSFTWDLDGFIRLANYDGTTEDLTARLDWANNLGFNAYYLDSFVSVDADHGILSVFRSKVGPNVHIFTEHSSALSMAIAACYEEVSWSGIGITLTEKQQILRWLYPESIIAAKFMGPLPPGGYAELYPIMFSMKLTPWVEDYRALSTAPGSENSILQPLVASRIGPDHRWL